MVPQSRGAAGSAIPATRRARFPSYPHGCRGAWFRRAHLRIAAPAADRRRSSCQAGTRAKLHPPARTGRPANLIAAEARLGRYAPPETLFRETCCRRFRISATTAVAASPVRDEAALDSGERSAAGLPPWFDEDRAIAALAPLKQPYASAARRSACSMVTLRRPAAVPWVNRRVWADPCIAVEESGPIPCGVIHENWRDSALPNRPGPCSRNRSNPAEVPHEATITHRGGNWCNVFASVIQRFAVFNPHSRAPESVLDESRTLPRHPIPPDTRPPPSCSFPLLAVDCYWFERDSDVCW